MTNLFDALEFCLREIEEGMDMETALARFPEHAAELRPILKTSVKAREMAVPEPSPEAVRRSRARVMQRSAELRELSAPKRRWSIPPLQRLVIAFGLVALFLLSGNGLLSASASALPGERLYPVKRGWENLRLFFIFDSEARELLKDEFENERLHEVGELIASGRNEVIDFAGIFMQVNGVTYISGLQVVLPAGISMPANGTAVLVSGQTSVQGFIEVISLEVLPAGSVVPVGNPITVETTPETQPSSGSGTEAVVPSAPAEVAINGTLQVIAANSLVVNGVTVYLDNTVINGNLCIGMQVDLKGYYADGKFIVREVTGRGNCSGGSSSGSRSGGNTNSGNDDSQNDDTTTNDNSNDDDLNDDNSNDDDSNDDDSNDDSGDDDGNDD